MFVSEKSQKIRTDDLKRFIKCRAEVEYEEFNLDKKTLSVVKKAENLSVLHNNLRRVHGNEKGQKIYKDIKTIFKNNMSDA